MPQRFEVPFVRNRKEPPQFVIEDIFCFLQNRKLALQRPQAFAIDGFIGPDSGANLNNCGFPSIDVNADRLIDQTVIEPG